MSENKCHATTHLVQLLVKLVKLRRLGHDILVHHEGWLDLLVAAFAQKVETV